MVALKTLVSTSLILSPMNDVYYVCMFDMYELAHWRHNIKAIVDHMCFDMFLQEAASL